MWASAVGNQAVQRLARRTVAREAVEEEEELEEIAPEPESVGDAAPAVEEASPEASASEPESVGDAAPAAEASPEGFAPEDAAGLAALDDLPEDELPG